MAQAACQRGERSDQADLRADRRQREKLGNGAVEQPDAAVRTAPPDLARVMRAVDQVGGPRQVHRVGAKRPNGLGIYDMSGNLWEWCLDISDKKAYSRAQGTLGNPVLIGKQYADLYGEGYDKILRALKNASGYRIVRGGSWGNAAYRLRCSARIRGKPASSRDWLGFRLVRELKKK